MQRRPGLDTHRRDNLSRRAFLKASAVAAGAVGVTVAQAAKAADSSEMTLYIYGKLYPVRPYSYFAGLYTAFTEVTPLLKSIDDMFVIFGSGDEVRLKYGPEPSRPPGATRRFLFYTNGYYKSDKATTISRTVEPLPFAAMSNFPYDPAVESYPTDAAHTSYLSAYNTRQQ